MSFSTLDIVHLLVIVCSTSAYPSFVHQQRRADPFVALANTLRQQEQQELQQQQQRGPVLDNGYYYDYGREGPSDDDLYQMEQFQRQLSRAAIAPFFGRTQRSNWGNVVDDGAAEYGVPVEAEVSGDDQALPSEWYDASVDTDQRSAYEEEAVREREQQKQEGQLLLDMLTEYMLLYGNGQAAAVNADTLPEENKRAEAKVQATQQPRNGSEREGKPKNDHGPAEVTTQAPATTAAPSDTVHRKEKQPPVRKSQDGTPLGQAEFPMMRPATQHKPQWMTTNQLFANSKGGVASSTGRDTNAKRHYTNKNFSKMSSIVTPDDELIEELDNLKMKKN